MLAASRIRRQPDRGRSVIDGATFKSSRKDGRNIVTFSLRLPSYRSLPLSCIEDVEVRIDGVPVSRPTLIVGGHRYELADLAERPDQWWFILDSATLEGEASVTPGEHMVDASIKTVEPYITNGRFTFTSGDAKTMTAVPEN